MMGVLRPELDGRTQRLYSSSKNCEHEWMSTPARCFLWSTQRFIYEAPTSRTTHKSQRALTKGGGNLELTGDVGGDGGAGTSASSSSSSSHSSSLRGVMLLPSHTEWMDTFNTGLGQREEPGASSLSSGPGRRCGLGSGH